MAYSPILIYQPGGGVPPSEVGIGDIEDAINAAGATALVEGQDYIDVVFGTTQTDDEWVFIQCVVVNTTDPDPLNIWPGIVTEKMASGFRIYFNGIPDSENYYLHWAISGTNIEATPATTYVFTGPSAGDINVASTSFTVALPPSSTLATSVTVTPDDGGDGGTFTPTSVTLTEGSPSATFAYTPVSYGTKTISVTNDGGLSDPASKSYLCVTSTYDFTGPSGGVEGVASTDFTVELPVGGVVAGTVTVTPSDGGGGGTFTPTSVGLTTAAPSATFTYTPVSAGDKTISVTNNGGLTDPDALTYTTTAVGGGLSDGDPVASWDDSSGNGHTATAAGAARPTFKTAIVNGKPVLRCVSGNIMDLATTISGDWTWTIFAVMKPTGAGGLYTLLGNDSFKPMGPNVTTTALGINDRAFNAAFTVSASGAFHVFTAMAISNVVAPTLRVDGSSVAVGSNPASANTGNFSTIAGGDGDLAEVIIFNNLVAGGTNRADIEKTLGDKYGITVAGGTAIDITTVTGLQGWWKADSL